MAWDFYPDRRVLHWRFVRPNLTEDDRSTSHGYRRTAVEVFGADRARITFLVDELPPVLRMMTRRFLLEAGLRGGVYRDLDVALAAADIRDWRPPEA